MRRNCCLLFIMIAFLTTAYAQKEGPAVKGVVDIPIPIGSILSFAGNFQDFFDQMIGLKQGAFAAGAPGKSQDLAHHARSAGGAGFNRFQQGAAAFIRQAVL